MNVERDLRPDDMRGRGYLNSILTLVRPQILDTLNDQHMSHVGTLLEIEGTRTK